MRRIVFALFAVVGLTACPSDIPKNDWIESMQAVLPAGQCHPQEYAMQCFDISQEVCIQASVKATNACLDSMRGKMPDKISIKGSILWGEKVGACMYQRYDSQFANRKKANPICAALRNQISKSSQKSQSSAPPPSESGAPVKLDTWQGK